MIYNRAKSVPSLLDVNYFKISWLSNFNADIQAISTGISVKL
jgi:hypothetical protein